MQQVQLHLLSTAIEFTEPGGAIRVDCIVRDRLDGSGGATVATAVADTRIGTAPETPASVFEPFVQAGQRLTRPHEGVGLGLAVGRDLARGMGATWRRRAAWGRGARSP